MTPDLEQRLAVGTPLRGKFERLGFTGKAVKCRPRHAFGFLSGPPGCGKTHFMCSCEGAYIINLDGSSMPVDRDEQMKAGVWPMINEEGTTLDVDGEPIIMTWEKVQEKVDVLKELALANEPRPDLVVLDTLPSGLDLGIDYLVRKNKVESWKKMPHGPSAWDDLYQLFVDFQFDLRRHGYGVYYICHVVDQYIQLGENKYKECPSLTITDSFWKRLFRRLELSLVMKNEWVVGDRIQIRRGQEVKIPGGGEKTCQRTLTINDEKYNGITKGRTEFADLALPAEGGWGTFEAAYTADSPIKGDD